MWNCVIAAISSNVFKPNEMNKWKLQPTANASFTTFMTPWKLKCKWNENQFDRLLAIRSVTAERYGRHCERRIVHSPIVVIASKLPEFKSNRYEDVMKRVVHNNLHTYLPISLDESIVFARFDENINNTSQLVSTKLQSSTQPQKLRERKFATFIESGKPHTFS